LLAQRLAGVPVAYLTGHKAFYGLHLQVDARVLDPRPDTEALVDWALDVIATLPRPASHANAHRVLDLGTGSGAIALAIAHAVTQVQAQATPQKPGQGLADGAVAQAHAVRDPQAPAQGLAPQVQSQVQSQSQVQVYALDASDDALAVARANAQRLGLHVPMRRSNWLAALPDWLSELGQPADARFALIVSNPPYICEGDAHLPALAHEPRQALTSGADGLDDIRHIVREARAWLAPGGWLLLEHGWDQHQTVQALLREAGFDEVQSRLDLASTPRCTGGRWPARLKGHR
jgi:release factor glutamine methyltransferase